MSSPPMAGPRSVCGSMSINSSLGYDARDAARRMLSPEEVLQRRRDAGDALLGAAGRKWLPGSEWLPPGRDSGHDSMEMLRARSRVSRVLERPSDALEHSTDVLEHSNGVSTSSSMERGSSSWGVRSARRTQEQAWSGFSSDVASDVTSDVTGHVTSHSGHVTSDHSIRAPSLPVLVSTSDSERLREVEEVGGVDVRRRLEDAGERRERAAALAARHAASCSFLIASGGRRGGGDTPTGRGTGRATQGGERAG
ncbi:hypothetical protein T484DRAFT_1895563, partial [Baffinella frigidus]